MDPESQPYADHFEPVPPIFQSTETGRAFERCVACDRFLLDDTTQYVIEKAFRSYEGFDARETIFEYALCVDCRDALMEELSEESLQRMQNYFASHVAVAVRRLRLIESAQSNVQLDPWISTCMISGAPVQELNEYQVYCECQGPNMLYSYAPFTIGGPVMDEIAELLSNKTLDELDGFADDILGLPPELEELFKRRVVLL